MALANTKTIGLADQFIQFLQDKKSELEAKGLNVDGIITRNTDLKNDAVVQVGKQDEAETSAKRQTKTTQTSVKTLYDSVSSGIDATMGILGKNTPEANQLGKLRSSLIKQSKAKKNGDEEK